MLLNFISGIVIITGTFFGLFGKQLQDKLAGDKSDRILATGENTNEKVIALETQNKELIRQNTGLSEKMESQSKMIDKLREENTDLYAKLAAASKSLYDQMTGGDSYCIFEVSFDVFTNKPRFNLTTVGKISLKNVHITIDDLARRSTIFANAQKNGLPPPTTSQIMNTTFLGLEFSSLPPNTSTNEIPILIEEGQKDIRMKISMFSDNGALFETLEVLNFRDVNTRKVKIEVKKGDKVLYKK